MAYVFQILKKFVVESEINKLKFQSSDDMNDCVRYISTINNKLNQMELNQSNQHTYTELISLKIFLKQH